MEPKAISERELVDLCMTELCQQSGFTNCRNMVQRDLEFICDNIEARTGVLISLSTIRRLFAGQFSRLPQIATLNALAMYLGYDHWQHYKNHKTSLASLTPADETAPPADPSVHVTSSRLHSAWSRWLLLTCLLVFTGLGLFAMFKFGRRAGNTDRAKFSINKTTLSDLPNSVVFHYDVEGVDADSFFIQQSWDKNRRVKIDKKGHTLTDIYYEPGYHIAKLIANDEVIRTIDVSIPTDRWFFYAKERASHTNPQYITPQAPVKNGSLVLDKNDLIAGGINLDKQHNYIQVYFPSVFKYTSDNFILKARVRVNVVQNTFCPILMCEIFCQRNFMYFMSTPKGCTSELNAQFSENILDGKTTDLSSLGSNVKEWQDIEFRVIDKKATILINGRVVMQGLYEQTAGLITGLGFISNGLPEIDSVRLENTAGEPIYVNNFDK